MPSKAAKKESEESESVSKIPEQYMDLFQTFDRSLVMMVNKTSRKMTQCCIRVENKLNNTERKMKWYTKRIKEKVDEEFNMADCLVTKELRSKIIMSQWTGKFLSATSDGNLDPITFAFARFSLNICLSYQDVTADYFIDSKIHVLLVSLAQFRSEIVIGPAVLGLLHLSFHEEMKHEIVLANALPAILQLLVTSESDVILGQCCKLIASLATHNPNKPPIVNSGCFHAIIDILGGIKTGDPHVRSSACAAAVNIIAGSDANKVLSIELDAIRPMLSLIQFGNSEIALYNAVKCLANIAFCNSFTGSKILSFGGDVILVDVLKSTDVLRTPELTQAIMICFSNICTSESNQSHIGSSLGLIDATLRIIDYARHPPVAAAACLLIHAIGWNNTGNKARTNAKGATKSLLRRIFRHALSEVEAELDCMEKAAVALASLMIFRSNHDSLVSCGGLSECATLCRKNVGKRLLGAVSTILVTMIPSPEELRRNHIDCSAVPVEVCHVLPILKRVQLYAFGHLAVPPEWLKKGIGILSMEDEALAHEEKWVKKEYAEKLSFFQEMETEVTPEVDFNSFPAAKGLIFSLY
jgi:hypothetical protein